MNSVLIYLMTLTGGNCVLLNSVQEFVEIKAWLLLTFFICLHNRDISAHFIVSQIKECADV